jgi:hypothetical protein
MLLLLQLNHHHLQVENAPFFSRRSYIFYLRAIVPFAKFSIQKHLKDRSKNVLDSITFQSWLMILVPHQDLASRQNFINIHYLVSASFENAFAATTSTGI